MKDDTLSTSTRGNAGDLEPDPVIEAYKKDVDRTLLRENLKLTVEERFLNLRQLQRFAEELRSARRGGGALVRKPPHERRTDRWEGRRQG